MNTKQNLKTVRKGKAIWDYLKRFDPEMQAQMMRAFWHTASDPDGVQMAEIMQEAEMSAASASRIVRALSKEGFKGKVGLGWVVSFEDPMNRRSKMVKLTPTGMKVLQKLGELFNE